MKASVSLTMCCDLFCFR